MREIKLSKPIKIFLKVILALSLVTFADEMVGDWLSDSLVILLISWIFLSYRNVVKFVLPFALAVGFLGEATPDFLVLPILGALVLYYIYAFKTRKKKGAETGMPKMSDEKEIHYKEAGLSDSEIKIFRETMACAQANIKKWEKNVAKNSKLKAIDLRTDGLKGAKGLFKELVDEPKKLIFADKFLYTHLPNIADLTDKYVEIAEHEIKNKETYATLEESAGIIQELSKQIADDYTTFVADDLEDIQVEISIAKKNIKVDNVDKNNPVEVADDSDTSNS